MSNLEELAAAVQALAKFYQPIFGYDLQGAKPVRNCEDRLADVKKIYDPLSAELGRPLRVLDLGCAQGYFSLHAAKWGGVVTGLDFDKANIDLCRLLARENPEFKANFVHARIEDFLPTVEAGEYDLVLCFSVLHLMTPSIGFQAVQEMLADLAEKVEIGLFEFALHSEFPENNLPKDYREFVQGYAFIRGLAYHEISEGNSVKRPLFFASNKYTWFENLGLLKIDKVIVSPAEARTSCYFCGDKFVKVFQINNSQDLLNANRENQFLETFGGKNGLPIRYGTLVEQDDKIRRIIIVRGAVNGIVLKDKLERGDKIDCWDIIRQVLEWQLLFEQYGFDYVDLHLYNFIYSDDGRIYPIDYENIRFPHELTRLGRAHVKLRFLQFMLWIFEPGLFGEPPLPKDITAPYHFRSHLLDLKKYITPWQYEQISAITESEKFFERLYEILFAPEKSNPGYTMAEAEFLAMERYTWLMGKKISEYEARLKKIEDYLTMSTPQLLERIEQLERIIEERLK